MASNSINNYPDYVAEMILIKKSLKSYPGYKQIASALENYGVSREVTAGLIGCIIPESGTDHTILNKAEYEGRGKSGTEGWNCGEGLVQWTYWEYKEPLIRKYNADKRSKQKLPTTWEEYKLGTPVNKNDKLYASPDGRHIAGLTLENQMLMLIIYYDKLIKRLSGETDLAIIVAKIYQQKAGNGFYEEIEDPVVRAYTTSQNKYYSSSGNHFLQSLKIAMECYGEDLKSLTYPINETYYAQAFTSREKIQIPMVAAASNTNIVPKLAVATKTKSSELHKYNDNRKEQFEVLRNALITSKGKTQANVRNVIKTTELYDSNILKSPQESKKERV